ncbi:hypothetical protein GF337_18520 [candidate division KSB1 bacterium]|nr:hypothetical protein [candidate division KSB1 bacterium]
MHSFKKYFLFSKNERIVIITICLIITILCSYKIHRAHDSRKQQIFSYKILKFKRNLASILSESNSSTEKAINRYLTNSNLVIDLNKASAKELQKLPNIGPVYAQRIIEYRNGVGKIKTIDELIKVKGIGKKRLKKLRPYLKISY